MFLIGVCVRGVGIMVMVPIPVGMAVTLMEALEELGAAGAFRHDTNTESAKNQKSNEDDGNRAHRSVDFIIRQMERSASGY